MVGKIKRVIAFLLVVAGLSALCAVPALADDSLQFDIRLYDYLRCRYTSSITGSLTNTYIDITSQNTPIHVSPSTQLQIYFGYKFYSGGDSTNIVVLKPNYTYHFSFNFSVQAYPDTMSNVSFDLLGDGKTFYYATFGSYSPSISLVKSLSTLNCDISFTVTKDVTSNYVYTFTFDYVVKPHADIEVPTSFDGYARFISAVQGWGGDLYFTGGSGSGKGYYDLDGSVYDALVVNQLSDLEYSIDNFSNRNHDDLVNIQNNLSSIDQSVDGVGQKVDDMSDAIQNKLDELAQQEEKKTQDSANDASEAGDALTDGIDLSFTESLNLLYQSLSYSGTSFNFQLPASGNIPFLNTQLWNVQDIPFRQYLDYVPQPVFVVLRLLLGLGFGLCLVAEIRSIISMINGERGE